MMPQHQEQRAKRDCNDDRRDHQPVACRDRPGEHRTERACFA
jgi:hypothetical protein